MSFTGGSSGQRPEPAVLSVADRPLVINFGGRARPLLDAGASIAGDGHDERVSAGTLDTAGPASVAANDHPRAHRRPRSPRAAPAA